MCPNREQSEITEKLAQVQQKYFAQLPEKISEIEVTWNKFETGSIRQHAVLDELYRHIHSLAGSSGTFGAEELSTTAKELQQHLRNLIDEKNIILPDDVDIIDRLILHIKEISRN